MDKFAVHTPPKPTKTASGTNPPGSLGDPTAPVTCPVCHAKCTWAGCWHCPTHGTAPFE